MSFFNGNMRIFTYQLVSGIIVRSSTSTTPVARVSCAFGLEQHTYAANGGYTEDNFLAGSRHVMKYV